MRIAGIIYHKVDTCLVVPLIIHLHTSSPVYLNQLFDKIDNIYYVKWYPYLNEIKSPKKGTLSRFAHQVLKLKFYFYSTIFEIYSVSVTSIEQCFKILLHHYYSKLVLSNSTNGQQIFQLVFLMWSITLLCQVHKNKNNSN